MVRQNRPPALFTIGYEGKTVEQLIRDLQDANVSIVVDTRYRPQSRKPGFSRVRLLDTLSGVNIRYQHRKDLGTPPELMQVKRETGSYELDAYEDYLDRHPEWVSSAAQDLAGERVALLCFERDVAKCHRVILAGRLAQLLDLKVKHL